jgi:hypothetical protein
MQSVEIHREIAQFLAAFRQPLPVQAVDELRQGLLAFKETCNTRWRVGLRLLSVAVVLAGLPTYKEKRWRVKKVAFAL